MLVDLDICDGDSENCLGRIEDIAVQGMRLASSQPFEVQSTLTFEMTLPSSSGDTRRVLLTARVMWCDEIGTPGEYRSGLELIGLSENEIDMLKRFMAQNAYENRWQDIARDMR